LQNEIEQISIIAQQRGEEVENKMAALDEYQARLEDIEVDEELIANPFFTETIVRDVHAGRWDEDDEDAPLFSMSESDLQKRFKELPNITSYLENKFEDVNTQNLLKEWEAQRETERTQEEHEEEHH